MVTFDLFKMLCLSLLFFSIFASKLVIDFWMFSRSFVTAPISCRALILKIQIKLWRNIFKLTDRTDYTKAMPSSILSRSFFWHIRIDFVSYTFLISLPISLNRFSSACLALSNSSWPSLTDLSQRSTMAAENTVEIEF